MGTTLQVALYKELVNDNVEYLSYGKKNFNELVTESKKNRRVRNGFLFKVLLDNQYTHFQKLAEKDSELESFRNHLATALHRLQSSSLTECAEFGQHFLNKYFRKVNVVLNEDKYDMSAEMAKYFETLVKSYRLKLEETSTLNEKLNEHRKMRFKVYM